MSRYPSMIRRGRSRSIVTVQIRGAEMNRRGSFVPPCVGDRRPPATLGCCCRPLLFHAIPLSKQVAVSSVGPRGWTRRGLPLLAGGQGRARPLGLGGGRCILQIQLGLGRIWNVRIGGSSSGWGWTGRRRWRLRMAAARRVRGDDATTSRARRGRPHDAGFGGRGKASRRPMRGRAGPGSPPVMLALSNGAMAFSGLSEFFQGRSMRWWCCSDLRRRGLLMVDCGVDGDGLLLGGDSRSLPCVD
jgi:hypothetical protein